MKGEERKEYWGKVVDELVRSGATKLPTQTHMGELLDCSRQTIINNKKEILVRFGVPHWKAKRPGKHKGEASAQSREKDAKQEARRKKTKQAYILMFDVIMLSPMTHREKAEILSKLPDRNPEEEQENS